MPAPPSSCLISTLSSCAELPTRACDRWQTLHCCGGSRSAGMTVNPSPSRPPLGEQGRARARALRAKRRVPSPRRSGRWANAAGSRATRTRSAPSATSAKPGTSCTRSVGSQRRFHVADGARSCSGIALAGSVPHLPLRLGLGLETQRLLRKRSWLGRHPGSGPNHQRGWCPMAAQRPAPYSRPCSRVPHSSALTACSGLRRARPSLSSKLEEHLREIDRRGPLFAMPYPSRSGRGGRRG